MTVPRRYLAIGTTLLFAVAAAVALLLPIPLSSERARQRVIDFLSVGLDAKVTLAELSVTVLPRPHVTGSHLTVRHHGRTDVPPLISVDAFAVDASFSGLWRKRLARVVVDGLDIQIPPRESRPRQADDERAGRTDGGRQRDDGVKGRNFVIDELVADASSLTVIPRTAGRTPKVWLMHELRLQNVGVAQKMPFEGVLTNAVPPGRIRTSGTFGPWNAENPGGTALDGTFTFTDADLGVFKGISGTLSARGRYHGSVERIEILGETDTPNFMVNISGHSVPLKATYHTIVDGTNGDTTLRQIDARFLNTSVAATGGVYGQPGARGRTVTLEARINKGRLEDVMRLAVKTPTAPMTGAVTVHTKLELPPGDADVIEKLRLDGRFTIGNGRFTNPDVRRKVTELSRRASGNLNDKAPGPAVESDFAGRFRLSRAVLTLSSLTFAIPGAAVDLRGSYALRDETIALSGYLFMDAKISQTTTGWKSVLLKIVNPLFRRDGQTVVPIGISGTRNAPSFGLDTKRVFKRDDPSARSNARRARTP